ncbi:ScrR [Schleiferilactobacillus shenzhenensis LY-73]|uniref:ScrR n=2 Tax=Schleiferilactobacillus shenzhenensis TaxID=1231337 RepID=U4TP09_9LACO|nr:ScrR [Schleiferilactobacillus shenzhenensis LY-73]
MRELNYHPNNIAQQLRGQGTKMIGVVISFITNPFFAYLVDAVDRALSAEGYRAVMLQTLEDPAKEAQYVAMPQSKQLDGVIMADPENDSDEVADLVQAGKIVLCNRYLGTCPLPIIQINATDAARLLDGATSGWPSASAVSATCKTCASRDWRKPWRKSARHSMTTGTSRRR